MQKLDVSRFAKSKQYQTKVSSIVHLDPAAMNQRNSKIFLGDVFRQIWKRWRDDLAGSKNRFSAQKISWQRDVQRNQKRFHELKTQGDTHRRGGIKNKGFNIGDIILGTFYKIYLILLGRGGGLVVSMLTSYTYIRVRILLKSTVFVCENLVFKMLNTIGI